MMDHDKKCKAWLGGDCTCWFAEYIDWEESNPPRISKGARPKHTVSGRSVFTILGAIIKRGAKK